MKIKILLVLLLGTMACFTASAQKVSMQFRQVKLAKVFDDITRQTGLTVAYSRPTVDPDRVVTIEADNTELSEVLGRLFSGTNVAFEIGEKKIYLKEKDATDATQQKGNVTVSGVVVDENGEPVIGASIVAKGTTLGVITNLDGEYTLANVPENAEINISFIGYKTLTFKAKDKALAKVTLQEDTEMLDEVVVVGYGVQRKRDVTTSISSMKASELTVPVSSVDQALVGKMTGVQVTQPSGMPGGGLSIKVRGSGSITAGTDPLYVVDGFPMSSEAGSGTGQNVSPLSTINMNDIESIEVLKDASAAAIYGSRGANGVVIITTKRVKKVKT